VQQEQQEQLAQDSDEAGAAERAVQELLLHPEQQAQQLQRRLGEAGGGGGEDPAAAASVLPEYLGALAHVVADPQIGGWRVRSVRLTGSAGRRQVDGLRGERAGGPRMHALASAC
jgi:hypothetical protein